MPEKRGSSFETAVPLIHDPDSAGDAPLGEIDEGPTEIKRSRGSGDDAPQEPSAADQELLGTTLDHFELLDCIGVGGMGRVYRARDNRLDRLVAIKVLSPQLAADPEILRRFEQEAKAAARLDDRHFSRVYFFGEDKGLNYIAMEFVEGENLRRRIQVLGRLDFTQVVNIGLQIARGLAHAAGRGVVHRDIKPSNIIVAPNGTAKLVDMGLARNFFQSSSPASELTQAGVTLGTFDYISPEQARDPRDADTRSDIYSLGCTLYHALTGRPPFPEGTALQKLLQHQSDTVVDPRRFVPDLPEPLVAVLMKMLAKNPRDRYQSPAELIRDLLAVSQILEVPLPDEPGYAGEAEAGQTLLERQLVWLVPMILFLGSVATYSYVHRARPVAERSVAGATALPEGALAASPSVPPDAGAPPPPRPRAIDVWKPAPVAEGQAAPAAPAAPDAAAAPRIPTGPRRQREVRANEDLRQVVQDALDGDELLLRGNRYDIEFTTAGKLHSGIVIDKDLTLRGEAANGMTTISVDDPRGNGSAFAELALFTVQGSSVAFENVKLNVRCSSSATNGINTIALEDGMVRLENCYLGLNGGPGGGTGTPCAMVSARGTGTTQETRILAHRCYFGGGQDGFRLGGKGSVDLDLRDCAFEQYDQPFVLDGMGARHCQMDRVSLFVGNGPVVRLTELGRATFEVANTVFSRLRNVSPWPLVEVQSDADRPVAEAPWWRGTRNLFHGFESKLLEVAKRTRATRLDELADWGVEETDSRELPQVKWPWALADPKNAPPTEELTNNPVRIFRLRSDRSELGLSSDGRPIGVLEGPWGDIYDSPGSPSGRDLARGLRESALKGLEQALPILIPPNGGAETSRPPTAPRATPAGPAAAAPSASPATPPPGEPKPATAPTLLVVDPSSRTGAEAGVFRRLANACDEVPPGAAATIELRTNEAVLVGDVKLNGQRITLRPGTGYRPKLALRAPVPGEAGPPRMFRLAGGARLRVEAVPLELDSAPWGEGEWAPTVFDCEAGSVVELDSVAARLGKDGKRPLARLLATRSAQPQSGPTIRLPQVDIAPARLALERCDIRVRGSLIGADSRALWSATIANSFVAAEGPMVNIQGGTSAEVGNQENQLELKGSTLLPRDSLIALDLTGKTPDPPRRLEVRAEATIILGSGGSVPLTRAHGELDMRTQRDAIAWQGNANYVGGFASLLYVSGNGSEGSGMPTQPNQLDKEQWLRYWNLADSGFVLVGNEAAENWAGPIWDLRPPTVAELRGFDPTVSLPDNLGVLPYLLPNRVQ